MSNNEALQNLSVKIEELKLEIADLKQTQSNSEKSKSEEKLIDLLTEFGDHKREISDFKFKELALKDRIVEYEKSVIEIINQRDRLIKKLHNRVNVLEQSLPNYTAMRFKLALKSPKNFPIEIIKASKAFGGAFKRKVTGKKKKYTLRKLPYNLASMPKSISKEMNEFEVNKSYNELFLMGLFDEPKKVSDLRIAAILDEFSYESFKYDSELITFRPDNWYEILRTRLPHLLLVESTWKGNSGSWQYKIAKYNIDQGNELKELLNWCKKNNIPTVFWNKEDPVHFEKFIDTAKNFDVIFTSDENCISKYKELVEHDNVYALPFAAQPVIHNPTKVSDYKKGNYCFAGSYYSNRHESRKLEQENLLDSAQKLGLTIYDRNHTNESIDSQFLFPERFHSSIEGSLPYTKLVQYYKKYKIFINVNSVTNSNTMFSRRVFELLASGTSIVSTYSQGIEHLFSDVVTIVNKNDNSGELLSKLLEDDNLRKNKELAGIREVFDKHTYAHRIQYVADKCGFNITVPYRNEVIVVANVSSQEEYNKLISNFEKQLYLYKKLVVITNDKLDITKYNPDLLLYKSDIENESLSNLLKEYKLDYDVLSIMKSPYYYGEHYLTDLLQAYIYTDADVIGNSENDFAYVSSLNSSSSFVIKKKSIIKFDIEINQLLTEEIDISTYTKYGLSIYSISNTNLRNENNAY